MGSLERARRSDAGALVLVRRCVVARELRAGVVPHHVPHAQPASTRPGLTHVHMLCSSEMNVSREEAAVFLAAVGHLATVS